MLKASITAYFSVLDLGSSGTLLNGCPNWGCAAQRAMDDWNLYLNRS